MVKYTQAALDDEVKSLPGYVGTAFPKQFSGYLQVSSNKFIHYHYFESLNKPAEDPLVFWTNGGPGCSGLLGLFTEMGPFRPGANGILADNPWSWTKLSSMVFLEQPAGVGFSYTTNPSLLSTFNDYRASHDNVQIIRSFFEKFPTFKNHSFYLASESYGGHYIPHWTYQLLNNPANEDLVRYFSGYLVGNPFTSFASGSIAMANVMWGLQLIPFPSWELMTKSTCDLLSHDAYFMSIYIPECWAYMDAIFEYTASLNPYALDFPVCPGHSFLAAQVDSKNDAESNIELENSQNEKNSRRNEVLRYPKWSAQSRKFVQNMKRISQQLRNKNPEKYQFHYQSMKSLLGDETHQKYSTSLLSPKSSTHLLEDKISNNFTEPQRDPRALQYNPCTEYWTHIYLNREDVQEALHVGPSSQRGQYLQSVHRSLDWGECSDEVNLGWAFNDYLADTTILYSKIFNHPKKPWNFKMLVFSGDSDGVCATVGTQHWIYNIEKSRVLSLYQPWYYEDSNYGHQAAGFLTKFNKYLSFATVHYAGHEVPAYQPEKALALFENYLSGSFFYPDYSDDYTPPSTSPTDTSSSATANKQLANSHVVPVAIAVLLFLTVIAGLVVLFLPKRNSPPADEITDEEASHH